VIENQRAPTDSRGSRNQTRADRRSVRCQPSDRSILIVNPWPIKTRHHQHQQLDSANGTIAYLCDDSWPATPDHTCCSTSHCRVSGSGGHVGGYSLLTPLRIVGDPCS